SKCTRIGRVATRSRQTIDEASADRVDDRREYDRHRAGQLLQYSRGRTEASDDYIRVEAEQLLRIFAETYNIPPAPADVHLLVAPVGPTQMRHRLLKAGDIGPMCYVLRIHVHKHADPFRPLALLRARRHRPRRRAAEERDDLAPPDHSITSSARASSVGGTSMPSALAVFRLINSSYLVDACTGRWAGFSPLRSRSMYWAARRYWSTLSCA